MRRFEYSDEKKIRAKLTKGSVEVSGDVPAAVPKQSAESKRIDATSGQIETEQTQSESSEVQSPKPLAEFETLLSLAHTTIGFDDGLLICGTRIQIY